MSLTLNAFTNSIKQYLNYTEQPWGKLFYLTAWNQIEDFIQGNQLEILDVGCGFGITSLEFSRRGHKVIGIDPTSSMIDIALNEKKKNKEKLDVEFIISEFQDVVQTLGKFDWIFCHNILEYVKEPRAYIKSISMCQDQGQHLSLIAHNPIAKVMKKAILNKNPEEALRSIDNNQEYSGIIQTEISTYSYDQLKEILEEFKYEIMDSYGIHNVYGYIADNEIKQNLEWHNRNMDLEFQLARQSPYKDIAIFRHIIAKKKE